jgi:hypothetical protein
VKWRKIPIPGTILQVQAKVMAEKLGHSHFKASNRFLQCFKSRQHIVFRDVCGDTSDVNEESVTEWTPKLPLCK